MRFITEPPEGSELQFKISFDEFSPATYTEFLNHPELACGVLGAKDSKGRSHAMSCVKAAGDCIECYNSWGGLERHPTIPGYLNGSHHEFVKGIIVSLTEVKRKKDCRTELELVHPTCPAYASPDAHDGGYQLYIDVRDFLRFKALGWINQGFPVKQGCFFAINDMVRLSRFCDRYDDILKIVKKDTSRFDVQQDWQGIMYVRATYKRSPELDEAAAGAEKIFKQLEAQTAAAAVEAAVAVARAAGGLAAAEAVAAAATAMASAVVQARHANQHRGALVSTLETAAAAAVAACAKQEASHRKLEISDAAV